MGDCGCQKAHRAVHYSSASPSVYGGGSCGCQGIHPQQALFVRNAPLEAGDCGCHGVHPQKTFYVSSSPMENGLTVNPNCMVMSHPTNGTTSVTEVKAPRPVKQTRSWLWYFCCAKMPKKREAFDYDGYHQESVAVIKHPPKPKLPNHHHGNTDHNTDNEYNAGVSTYTVSTPHMIFPPETQVIGISQPHVNHHHGGPTVLNAGSKVLVNSYLPRQQTGSCYTPQNGNWVSSVAAVGGNNSGLSGVSGQNTNYGGETVVRLSAHNPGTNKVSSNIRFEDDYAHGFNGVSVGNSQYVAGAGGFGGANNSGGSNVIHFK